MSDGRDVGRPARALTVATIWLSPAALLAVPTLLLADGAFGLWTPLALSAGAVVTALLLAEPASRRTDRAREGLTALVRHRWPTARATLAPFFLADVLAVLLFLWAQLAAGRELADALGGWPSTIVAGLVAALVVAAWRDAPGAPLVDLGSAVAVLGLVLPLAAVLAVTTPWWPRVWAEVASRARVTFSEAGTWTTRGRAVRGPSRMGLTLSIPEEQRVTLLGRGRVRIEAWEGGDSGRDVVGETELTLRPGDRLTVPVGLAIRFQPDRRIPGAPAAGPDWVDPPGRRPDGRWLLGLAVTGLAGGLGLPLVHGVLHGGATATVRAARNGAAVAVLGLASAVLWTLYAVWLTPEVYLTGVSGVEVYELAGNLPGFPGGGWLRLLALGGLAAGGLATALGALRVLPRPPGVGNDSGSVLVGVAAIAGVLALTTPAGSWPVLLAALGLAASAGAPGVLFACWGERVTPRALGLGASLGLALFALLSVAGLLRPGSNGPTGSSAVDWVLAWPALVAMPANALVVWFLSTGPAVSSRSSLPPGLADLYE